MLDSNTKNKNFNLFKDVYFSESDDFKTNLLPYWIKKFSSLIAREQSGKIPRYYAEFSQGTLVMVDFGVRIGGEISGGHFGVVLNKNDTKYERNIIVVPLTSKKKSRYIPLDYEVMEECSKLLFNRSESCLKKIEILEDEKEKFINEFNTSNKHFSFNTETETTIFRECGIENSSSFTIELSTDPNSNNEFRQNLNKLKNHKNFSQAQNVKSFVETSEIFLNSTERINQKMTSLVSEIEQFKTLEKRMERYTKSTYADVNNITTVSKLRAKKISEYTISGNISLSETSIDKLKNKLSSII